MALVKCLECAKEISDTATLCPNCGAVTLFAQEAKQKQASYAFGFASVGTAVTYFIFPHMPWWFYGIVFVVAAGSLARG